MGRIGVLEWRPKFKGKAPKLIGKVSKFIGCVGEDDAALPYPRWRG